jgi:Mn2+/Fe2+ NRAMP family transporter
VKARKPLAKAPEQGPDAIERIKVDTYIGMTFSNLVALAIMFTTAATLHAAGPPISKLQAKLLKL